MARLTLQSLGRKLQEKRGPRGIRETASEIGVSPATLSRVERGYMPDLQTFAKVCRWLEVDPGEVLGVGPGEATPPELQTATVHFRKDRLLSEKTARALARLILAAQRAVLTSSSS